MKSLRICLISLLVIPSFVSCIDSDYHWDNLNTEGVLNIPPIPLGSYEQTFFKDLDFISYEIPGGESKYVVQYEDTLKNIFSTSVIKDFFHKYMERDVTIEGDLVMDILSVGNDLEIELEYNVAGDDYKAIEALEMNSTKVESNSDSQKILIAFPQEMGEEQYRDLSKHLLIKIKMTSSGEINFDAEKSYMKLSDLVIKTSGYFIDL